MVYQVVGRLCYAMTLAERRSHIPMVNSEMQQLRSVQEIDRLEQGLTEIPIADDAAVSQRTTDPTSLCSMPVTGSVPTRSMSVHERTDILPDPLATDKNVDQRQCPSWHSSRDSLLEPV